MPARVKINNELLRLEMQKILGISFLNHDQLMPFRSIVPYEQQFRALLEEKKEKFAEVAARCPDDPAVKRTRQWLPMELAYQTCFGTHSDGFYCLATTEKESSALNAEISYWTD
jgi:hypothetical protein